MFWINPYILEYPDFHDRSKQNETYNDKKTAEKIAANWKLIAEDAVAPCGDPSAGKIQATSTQKLTKGTRE